MTGDLVQVGTWKVLSAKSPHTLHRVSRVREGEVPTDEKIDLDAGKGPDVVMDSLGNEIKVKKEKGLTARETKRRVTTRAARRAQGLPADSEED